MLAITVISFIDRPLAVGLFLLGFLSVCTWIVLSRAGLNSKYLFRLLLLAIFIYASASIFIHYTGFQPFGGGMSDGTIYNTQAQKFALDLREGKVSLIQEILSFPDTSTITFFPIIVGFIYFLTIPSMIVGLLFGAWLATISVICVFLIVKEIGGSEQQGFIAGFLTLLYPSYLFYGSFLLRETLIVPLAILGLLLIIKLINNFSWRNFVFLYLVLILLVNIKFYIAYPLIFTFIFCWLALSKLGWKNKLWRWIIMFLLLGFIPQIGMPGYGNQPGAPAIFGKGAGYYGISSMYYYLNANKINFYRTASYVGGLADSQKKELGIAEYSDSKKQPEPQNPSEPAPAFEPQNPSELASSPLPEKPAEHVPGVDSAYVSATSLDNPVQFAISYFKSFIYALLGPLPWQIRYARQFLALGETFPWYVCLIFIIIGIFNTIKSKYRIILPIIFFSTLTLAVLALFTSNFGALTRVRIPAFIPLLCLLPFGLTNLKNIKNVKIYEMLSYWRSRVYR